MSVCRISLLFLLLACGGCGVEEKALWQDASAAQDFFAQSASQEALLDNTVESLSLRCEDLLPAAQSALEEPGSPGLRVLLKVCSQEHLGFGGDLRCVDGALQVRCL